MSTKLKIWGKNKARLQFKMKTGGKFKVQLLAGVLLNPDQYVCVDRQETMTHFLMFLVSFWFTLLVQRREPSKRDRIMSDVHKGGMTWVVLLGLPWFIHALF